jgi:hypothetical protein
MEVLVGVVDQVHLHQLGAELEHQDKDLAEVAEPMAPIILAVAVVVQHLLAKLLQAIFQAPVEAVQQVLLQGHLLLTAAAVEVVRTPVVVQAELVVQVEVQMDQFIQQQHLPQRQPILVGEVVEQVDKLELLAALAVLVDLV